MKKTKEQISYNMRRVKNKDSKIEILFRKELWKRGVRYRKNDKTVTGHPDISIKKKKIVIFIDGEFWHGFDWDNKKNEIKSNREFWINKIERNMTRDKEVNAILEKEGWLIFRFWGTSVKKHLDECVEMVMEAYKKR